MGRTIRVAILASSEIAFGRRIIRGVGDFARSHGRWELYFNPFHPLRMPDSAHFAVDGVIAHPRTADSVAALGRFKGPLVRVGGSWPAGYRSTPVVSADNAKAVQLVVEDLVGRGFRRFAFAGEDGTPASEARGHSLEQQVQARGGKCARHIGVSPFALSEHWEEEIASLAAWLETLETPVAVVATNDERAFVVVEACRRIGRRIPNDVAVVGFDNSVELCETCNPSLSSVDMNAEGVGYRAAELLSEILDSGVEPPSGSISPRGLVHRESTDVLAVDDPDLAMALRFIRQNLDKPLRISDIVRQVPLSRRVLEQRFQQHLHRSPKAEIQRLQLQRVATLLLDTDWTIKQIAHASGFANGEQLARTFHHVLGLTPSGYRAQGIKRGLALGASSLTLAGQLAEHLRGGERGDS